jgi:hypothetical protein
MLRYTYTASLFLYLELWDETSKSIHTGSEAQPAPYSGHQCYLPEIKRPGREVDHSHLSSAEVKNERNYTSASPIYLHCIDRDNFTFTFGFVDK